MIEAKYRSGKHDHAVAETDATGEGPLALADQLCRQVRSIEDLCNGGWASEAGLTRAVQNARLRFLYIVDERRLRRCMREFRASVKLAPPRADLRILTWQRLHRLLHLIEDRGSHWAWPLRDYLEYAGLDAYCGIHSMNRTTATACRPLKRWRLGASGQNERWDALKGSRRATAVKGWQFEPSRRSLGVFMKTPLAERMRSMSQLTQFRFRKSSDD
ncbi:MAG: hypothetical protein IT430_14360 [Phycisphaerales bacterium]|nr:hypothetical protein [Phycisphaerales bacterium]